MLMDRRHILIVIAGSLIYLVQCCTIIQFPFLHYPPCYSSFLGGSMGVHEHPSHKFVHNLTTIHSPLIKFISPERRPLIYLLDGSGFISIESTLSQKKPFPTEGEGPSKDLVITMQWLDQIQCE